MDDRCSLDEASDAPNAPDAPQLPAGSPPLALSVHGARVDVVVRPGATIGELAERLGLDPAVPLAVDGQLIEPTTAVAGSGLCRGSTVGERVVGPPGGHHDAAVRVSVVAGPVAGRSWDLLPGQVVLGSAPGTDVRITAPGIARHHALGCITAGNAGWTDLTDAVPPLPSDTGVCRVGPVLLRSRPVGDGGRQPPPERPQPGPWTVPWCRPVLPPEPPALPAVRPPAPADPPSPVGAVGWAALLTPLVVGGAATLVLRQPLLLVLGAAGALATLVPRLVQAVRGQRSRRRAAIAADAELRRFAADLEQYRRAAAARAWSAVFDIAAAVEVCAAPDARLWSRRPASPGAFAVTLGVGTGSCRPTVEPAPPPDDPALWALVEAASDLHDVPVPLALTGGQVVGVVGDDAMARAVGRAIVVQLAAIHGPADLVVAAAADASVSEWQWMTWLPHVADGAMSLVAAADAVEALAAAVAAASTGRHAVVVVDGPAMLSSRTHPLRRLLDTGGPVSMVVIAPDAGSLPACCTSVVEVRADGAATVRASTSTGVPERLTAAGLALEDAERAARALARFDDPEIDAATDLPAGVDLVDVLPPHVLDDVRLAGAWADAGADPPPATVIGRSATGPVEVDLVRDGPHALVAGTTGAGKSELLRSLVVGLAASQSPEHLTFVLVDYKGGSAFEACRNLPHVVGLVTDLDGGLADRVLRSLGAELSHRERLLRDAGASDLAAYRSASGNETIPRLVLVVDEFAALAAEQPTFLSSLVAVAQRGRSLGVHLVLATQRPAGVVSDEIRANTNLRIALRVQDPADSTEVLGDPVAATLPRRPGRAIARFGLGELVALHVASGTGPVPDVDPPPVAVLDSSAKAADGGPSMLAAVVGVIREAAAAGGAAAPRRPWVDPLPGVVAAGDLPSGAFALVDDPDRQRRFPLTWDRSAGHLVVVGAVGSGTTTTLVTAALAAAAGMPPDRLHVYAVDNGPGGLAALAAVPHTAAVIGGTERERQLRLLDRLDDELDTRATAADQRPEIVVAVDDLPAWRRALDDAGEHRAVGTLDRVLAGGPQVGIVVAAGAIRDAGLPPALDGTVATCLALRRSAPDHSIGRDGAHAGAAVPGRGVEVGSGLEVQVAVHPDADEAAAAVHRRHAGTDASRWPRPIGTLPARVRLEELPPPAGDGPAWAVPVGIDDATLTAAVVTLHRGDHLLVSGPSRSGRTSALRVLADQLQRARRDAAVVAVGSCGAVPDGSVVLDDVSDLAAYDPRHLVVVVDDAEQVGDVDDVLGGLVAGRDAIVLAAGRSDALRAAYGHWTAALRRQRRGVVLCPTADVDGDVLGVVLPRHRQRDQHPGRGFLVLDGDVRRVQLALAHEQVAPV